jgi:hypothetical protein
MPSLTKDAYLLTGNDVSGDNDADKNIFKSIHPVVVHNSLAWVRKEMISVRVSNVCAYVRNDNDSIVNAQIDPFYERAPATGMLNTFLLLFFKRVCLCAYVRDHNDEL